MRKHRMHAAVFILLIEWGILRRYMAWVIVGLGNPGEEYDSTRHNTGRMALQYFADSAKIGPWKDEKKSNAQVASGMLGKNAVILIAPDTFMNKSGNAAAKFVK